MEKLSRRGFIVLGGLSATKFFLIACSPYQPEKPKINIGPLVKPEPTPTISIKPSEIPKNTPVVLQPLGCTVPAPEDFIDPRVYADQDAILMKKALEKEFATRITTDGERYEQKCGGPFLVDGHPNLRPKWDVPTLSMLKEFLYLVPSHFYQKREDGREIIIVLATYSSEASCYPFGFAAEFGPCTADINHSKFNTSHKKEAFSFLTHELIHTITPAVVINPNAPRTDWESLSPWYDKLKQIMGGDINQIRDRLYNLIQDKRNNLGKNVTDINRRLTLDQDLTEEEHEELFYRRFEYGLGYYPGGKGSKIKERTNPNEFLAVLGEYYIHGKDYFIKLYGELLDTHIAKELYQFVKNDIYRGKEYLAFPI